MFRYIAFRLEIKSVKSDNFSAWQKQLLRYQQANDKTLMTLGTRERTNKCFSQMLC